MEGDDSRIGLDLEKVFGFSDSVIYGSQVLKLQIRIGQGHWFAEGWAAVLRVGG